MISSGPWRTSTQVRREAALSASGSAVRRSRSSNLAIGTFAFTYIPGFMASLALVLDLLSIRSLRARMGRGRPVPALAEQTAGSEAK
jgi:hypothetical protein